MFNLPIATCYKKCAWRSLSNVGCSVLAVCWCLCISHLRTTRLPKLLILCNSNNDYIYIISQNYTLGIEFVCFFRNL